MTRRAGIDRLSRSKRDRFSGTKSEAKRVSDESTAFVKSVERGETNYSREEVDQWN